MPELSAVTDLAYDATSLQQDPIGIFLRIVRGLNAIPSVRGEDDVVASKSGRSPYPRLADVLAIELSGLVLGIGDTEAEERASFRGLIEALKTLLAAGSLAPKVLSCTLEDGATATINARVVDFQVTELIESVAAEVKVALESVDPDWDITPAP